MRVVVRILPVEPDELIPDGEPICNVPFVTSKVPAPVIVFVPVVSVPPKPTVNLEPEVT